MRFIKRHCYDAIALTYVILAVGGGDHSEFKEIEAMATDESHVFRIRDQYAVPRERAKILEKIGLREY